MEGLQKSWVSRKSQRCGNCDRFITTAAPGGNNNNTGACCAHPPVPFLGQAMNPAARINPQAPAVIQVIQSMWPPVQVGQWCGEWTPKTEGDA